MADPSPLAGLMDRAHRAFILADQLGRDFQDELEQQRRAHRFDESAWSRLRPAFDELCQSLVDLRHSVLAPPEGFAAIADELKKTAQTARRIRDSAARPECRMENAFLDFFAELNTVARDGVDRLEHVRKGNRPKDLLDFSEQTVPDLSESADAASAVLPPKLIDPVPQATSGETRAMAFLRVLTNGRSDALIAKALQVQADESLTANEKLVRIDELIGIPSTASAQQLGDLLGVVKQAILKTDWWIKNRRGEKESEIGRRHDWHRRRAKGSGTDDTDGEE